MDIVVLNDTDDHRAAISDRIELNLVYNVTAQYNTVLLLLFIIYNIL